MYNVERLITEFNRINAEQKRWSGGMGKTSGTKRPANQIDYTESFISTIHVNACMDMKASIARKLGIKPKDWIRDL